MRRSKPPIAEAESFAQPIAVAVGSVATSLTRRRCTTRSIVADPKDVDRIYIMNVFVMVSDDGGRTVRRLGERNQSTSTITMIWINPHNTDHYLIGCDGGIYES